MKRLFLGSVALVALGLGTPAVFAAERPVPAPAYAPPPAPVYTWNGCYVGASAGTSSGSSQHFDTAGNAITNSFDLSGFIGGGPWAKIDASEWLTTNPIATGHQESSTRSGWTVGGGIEYALGYGWSVKSEFLYADFGTFQTFTSPPFGAAGIEPRDVKVKDYVWRAGMNYKFW